VDRGESRIHFNTDLTVGRADVVTVVAVKVAVVEVVVLAAKVEAGKRDLI